jgi:glyoxylase-like metal-dependent hydrolase (beta-lactamase superfamily II)
MADQISDNPTDLFKLLRGKSPEEAKFFWSGGPIEVAERTWFQSVFSGCTGFETSDGVVLVDSGLAPLGAKLAALLRQKTGAPIHTAIFTHGHVDHAFGLSAFLIPGQKPPRVIAHRAVADRFDRYERTRRHNAALNARQFGGAVQEAEASYKFDNFKRPSIMPDTFYDDELTIEVGGVRFDIRHGRGETDDHSYVHCAERGVLCSGDFFIWSVPNAGNPQKVQRYPWDWAKALRRMAALNAHSLCPGHGGPVVNDAAKIKRMLTETADYLDAIVDQTIAAMEAGSPPHVDIVRSVAPPQSSSPWLQPVYDEAEFIVRNVIRYYGGWWSGRPSDLKPAPRAAVAGEVARLAGGAAALLARARAVAASDLPLACHLADYVLEAQPDDPEVRHAVASLYEQRAGGETSLMARNLFRSAAAYARAGRPFR